MKINLSRNLYLAVSFGSIVGSKSILLFCATILDFAKKLKYFGFMDRLKIIYLTYNKSFGKNQIEKITLSDLGAGCVKPVEGEGH